MQISRFFTTLNFTYEVQSSTSLLSQMDNLGNKKIHMLILLGMKISI